MASFPMVGTFSKHPRAFGFEPSLRVINGDGGHIRLTDGKEYIDWVCGLGANLLGYGNPSFVNAVSKQLFAGAGFSLPHYLEDSVAIKLAQVLTDHVPGWKDEDVSVRLAKTGSEANGMALRLARAVTGRELVLHAGYGGWFSEFITAEPPGYGVPQGYKSSIRKFNFGETAVIDEYVGQNKVAAVMLEQGAYDPPPGFYQYLRKFCDESGALFILDEVVTGLRFAMGGAAEKFGVYPDIVTMGKGLGNGFAVSAVAAKREILDWFARDDPVFCSSTHWGEAVSLAAAHSMLNIWSAEHVDYIEYLGERLVDGLTKIGWGVIGHPVRSVMIFGSEYERAFFVHGMRAKGILMNRPNFISFGHDDEDVDATLRAAEQLRQQIEQIGDRLPSLIAPEHIPHVLFPNR